MRTPTATRTASWCDESAATDSDGRFRIVRFHDRGALGEVYVARDQQLHRIVALKRIQSGHAVDRDKCARFVVEAEITGRLEHPGIVPVYGLGTYDDGRPFYAMRFIRGDNLKSAIENFHRDDVKGRGPGERTLALLKLLRRYLDVCNAIDYAHSRGVLHRDLKPGNIMLGKFGETLVVDWGLAKSLGRKEAAPASATMDDRTLVPQSGSDLRGTELGARLGTPAYMSPEQAAGKIDALGPASDVYSLGATLYCLLTGRAPFADPDMAELLRKVERGDFPPPRQLKGWVDPALEAICLKAMATEPAGRYRTPRALADDVEHWLADEPVSAWREPIRRRLRRWGRRHRLLVTSLGATLLVAVAALAVGNVLVARQRDRAERNLTFARTVVDEMYTQVAEKLDDEEHLDDYQREILEKALAFYERFALPQSRDPQVRLEASRAGLRVGAIRSRLGRTEAAEEAYRRTLVVLSGLVSDHPAEPVHREALAQAHLDLSAVFGDQLHWDQSERELKESAALWEALAREAPGVGRYRSKLADAHSSLGRMYTSGERYGSQPRHEEAEAEFRRALDAAERLAREQPEVGDYQASLATILQRLGLLRIRSGRSGAQVSLERAAEIAGRLARSHPKTKKYQYLFAKNLRYQGSNLTRMGRPTQAEESLKGSIAVLEKLVTDHPEDMQIASELGTTYLYYQELLRSQVRRESALEWSGSAIRLFRSLASRDSRNLENRELLWESIAEQGETLMRLGRHTEALANFGELIESARASRSLEVYRAFHTLSKARLGDLSELAQREDRIRAILGVPDPDGAARYHLLYFDMACLQAALARLAFEPRERPQAEPRRLAQPDLDRALQLLDEARAAGEFPGMIRLDEIRREPLLEPLRTNPRFQLLLMDMMDLEFPDDPFGP